MNVTTSVMHALRRDLYPPTRYIWATEVSVPSDAATRRMDVATIDTAASPYLVEGFEIKVSRADWLNDKNGEKSKPARQAVDKFWFVFGDTDCYKDAEVPAECGIIHIHNSKAIIARQAAVPQEKLSNYCRELLSTILVRTIRAEPTKFVSQVDREAEKRGYQKGVSAAKRASPYTNQPAKPKYDPGRYNFDDGIPLDLP